MTNRRPQLGDRSASDFGKEATLGKYGRSVGGRFPSRRVSSGLQGAELST
jgi:hypothetical protein